MHSLLTILPIILTSLSLYTHAQSPLFKKTDTGISDSFNTNLRFKRDSQAIKHMTGCFEVSYQFKETKQLKPNHPISSKDYSEKGVEWIAIDNESNNHISLQHILVHGDQVQKHWRQDWTYHPTTQIIYLGHNVWENQTLSQYDKNKNLTNETHPWSQVVYQVDDAPRYGCIASWKHSQKNSVWECKSTFSPLPRREFAQRSDYNLLMRDNTHIVQNKGWIHEQFNQKINQTGGNLSLIAQEDGANRYKKIAPKHCQAAKTWWKKHHANWQLVKNMWHHIFEHHPKIEFVSTVENQPLWQMLFSLEENYANSTKDEASEKKFVKEIHDTIHLFMKHHEKKQDNVII